MDVDDDKTFCVLLLSHWNPLCCKRHKELSACFTELGLRRGRLWSERVGRVECWSGADARWHGAEKAITGGSLVAIAKEHSSSLMHQDMVIKAQSEFLACDWLLPGLKSHFQSLLTNQWLKAELYSTVDAVEQWQDSHQRWVRGAN